MDLFVRAVHACPTVLMVLTLLWLNKGFQKLRDRSLFIPWGRGGGRGFWGDHLIFRRTKGGISRNWEPNRGDHWKLSKDLEGGPLKFAWKMKTWGKSNVVREDHALQWSNIQSGDQLNFTLFSPKSSPPPGDK